MSGNVLLCKLLQVFLLVQYALCDFVQRHLMNSKIV